MVCLIVCVAAGCAVSYLVGLIVPLAYCWVLWVICLLA